MDSLVLNAHHAAFDGRSCVRLLQLIADKYGVGWPAKKRARTRRPPTDLRQRRRAGAPAGAGGGTNRGRERVTGREGVPAAGGARRADSLPACEWPPTARAPGYGFVLLGWPGVPAAPQRQNEPRVTVNDLLIAALIRAIMRWNASAHRRPGRVRISMPVDVRPPGRGDELGNLSRLCAVTADPLSTAALTAVVASQTRRSKGQPGPPVSPAQAAVAKAPLPTPVKRRIVRLAVRCLGRVECDTSLLSNLGNITDAPRFGMLSPTRMWFSTSAHMPRGLSVGAITVDGQLQLCFRYRNALFDAAAAHDFATEYAAALATLALGRSPLTRPEPSLTTRVRHALSLRRAPGHRCPEGGKDIEVPVHAGGGQDLGDLR